jgi:hypothetical protein
MVYICVAEITLQASVRAVPGTGAVQLGLRSQLVQQFRSDTSQMRLKHSRGAADHAGSVGQH